MAFIYDLTDTWNAGGTTFNAIKMNVTDSASAAASKLITLQVGGAERFGVDKAGIGTFASVVRVAAGSTGAPAFSFTTNTNTGMWSPSSDAIAFSTAGSERFRVDSSGNVGIGTSSPSSYGRLSVNGNIVLGPLTRNQATTQSVGVWTTGDPADDARANIGFITVAGAASSSSAITFSTNNYGVSGGERMRIDSSGNVGIGSVPGVRFQITHDQAAYSYFDYYNTTNAGGIVWRQIVRNLANTGTTSVDLAKLISSGFVINNNDTNAANFTAFGVGGSERMRIDSSGNLLVGKTTTSLGTSGFVASATGMSATNANAEAANFNRQSSDGDLIQLRRGTTQVGSISVSTTSTSFNTSSDARLKHDIIDAPEASDLIDAIKVRSFKWNTDDSEQRYGFVAQELVEVAPEAVSVPQDEEQMMAVDYSKLVPMLVKEIQSLRARMAQLEASASTITFEGN